MPQPAPEGAGGNYSGTATPGGTLPPVTYAPRSDAQGLRDYADQPLVDTGGPISGLGGDALASGASREDALRLNESSGQAIATGDNAFGETVLPHSLVSVPGTPGATAAGSLPSSDAPGSGYLSRPTRPEGLAKQDLTDPTKQTNQVLSPGTGEPASAGGGAMTQTDRDKATGDFFNGMSEAEVMGRYGPDTSSGAPRSTLDALHGTGDATSHLFTDPVTGAGGPSSYQPATSNGTASGTAVAPYTPTNPLTTPIGQPIKAGGRR